MKGKGLVHPALPLRPCPVPIFGPDLPQATGCPEGVWAHGHAATMGGPGKFTYCAGTTMHSIHSLLRGYLRFSRDTLPSQQERFAYLSEHGQKPLALLFGCSDSRAVPEAIFDTGPGELFTVRNIANIVPAVSDADLCQSSSAAITFAVDVLQVPNAIVMGHAECGGIATYLKHRDQITADPSCADSRILRWVSHLKSAEQFLPLFEQPELSTQRKMEFAGIYNSMQNLRQFHCISNAEKTGTLHVDGIWFDIQSGTILIYDDASHRFVFPELHSLYSSIMTEDASSPDSPLS